jgi:hypothetical protein
VSVVRIGGELLTGYGWQLWSLCGYHFWLISKCACAQPKCPHSGLTVCCSGETTKEQLKAKQLKAAAVEGDRAVLVAATAAVAPIGSEAPSIGGAEPPVVPPDPWSGAQSLAQQERVERMSCLQHWRQVGLRISLARMCAARRNSLYILCLSRYAAPAFRRPPSSAGTQVSTTLRSLNSPICAFPATKTSYSVLCR